jgi:hypothetical protein
MRHCSFVSGWLEFCVLLVMMPIKCAAVKIICCHLYAGDWAGQMLYTWRTHCMFCMFCCPSPFSWQSRSHVVAFVQEGMFASCFRGLALSSSAGLEYEP